MVVKMKSFNFEGVPVMSIEPDPESSFFEDLVSDLGLKHFQPYVQEQRVDLGVDLFSRVIDPQITEQIEAGVQLLDSFLTCDAAKKVFEQVLDKAAAWGQLIFTFGNHQCNSRGVIESSVVHFAKTVDNGDMLNINIDLSRGHGYNYHELLQMFKGALNHKGWSISAIVDGSLPGMERNIEDLERNKFDNQERTMEILKSCRRKWNISKPLEEQVTKRYAVPSDFAMFFIRQNILGDSDVSRIVWQEHYSERYCEQPIVNEKEYKLSCANNVGDFFDRRVKSLTKNALVARTNKLHDRLKKLFSEIRNPNIECVYSKELCEGMRKIIARSLSYSELVKTCFPERFASQKKESTPRSRKHTEL